MAHRICQVVLCLLASLSCVYGDTPYDGTPFETSAKAVQETNRLQNEVIFHELDIDHACHYENWTHRMATIQDKNFEACKKIRKQVDQDTSNRLGPRREEDKAAMRTN